MQNTNRLADDSSFSSLQKRADYGGVRYRFLSAFNTGVISATQRFIPGAPNKVAYFADIFHIRTQLLRMSDNLLSTSYAFEFSDNNVDKYWPRSNTFAITPDIEPKYAIHEATHGYNDTVLGINFADPDEALAYMLTAIVSAGFNNNFKEWEARLEGECPVGNEAAMDSFMKHWNYRLWVLAMSALTTVRVNLGGESEGRPVTENDYIALKNRYGIHVSCEKYKAWSLETIKKNWGNTCNTKCITLKCPNTLWSIFK